MNIEHNFSKYCKKRYVCLILEDMEDLYVQSDSQFMDMAQWFAFIRRHNANIFDVFFKDRDNISDKEIVSTIEDVASFFSLPMPAINEKCSTIAEVLTSEDATKCELFYNRQLMEKAGINNLDTLRLALVHELSHQALFQTHFLLFENELWIQELAADMMVGAFSIIGNDVATGKYKYMLKQLPASLTHPDGKFRSEIIEYGRRYYEQLRSQGRYNGIKDMLTGLPAFVYFHYQELQESWDKIKIEDVMKDPEKPAERKPIDYESLPDTNLLKQYWLKHKDDKKTKDEK